MKIDFKSIIIVAIVITLFSSVIYYFTIDRVIPKVVYKNYIEFDLAFKNFDDVVFYKTMFKGTDTSDKDMTSRLRLEVSKSDSLNNYRITVPYDNKPFFTMGFGEEHPIDFAIANLKVNNNVIANGIVASNLRNIGYEVNEESNIIYAHPVNLHSELDLYKIAKNCFIFTSSEEVNANIEDDQKLRNYYFVFILFITSIIFIKCNIYKKIESCNKIFLSIFLYVMLFVTSLLLVNQAEIASNEVNIFFILKNNLGLIVLPIFVYIFFFNCNRIIRVLGYILAFSIMLLVGIDLFVQNIFGTRFLYDTIGTYAGTVSDGLPFFVSFVTSYSGFYYICAVLLFLIFYWCKPGFKRFISIKFVMTTIMLLCIVFMFTGNSAKNYQFYNTFQVNIFGWFSEGNNKRNYENYKRYSLQDLEYEEFKGLNQKKDVIVLLVESLSCEVTFLCGNKEDLLPNLSQIAKDNVFFPFYYSNNVNTNGAIFTITTGYPHIVGSRSKESYVSMSYYQKDMINAFHKYGYRTAYYSPAKFILGKDKQLAISNYDYLSSSDDAAYNNSQRLGVFGSVSDEDMFNKIINDLKEKSEQPYFIMLTTISTHTPYVTPWGYNNLERAFAYTDYAITEFLQKLNDIKYFEHGIVIITGDHRGWGNNDTAISNNSKSRITREQVPLIMIDGVNHNVLWDKSSFSHSSLGVMLEYMMLPVYEKNKFQINPIVDGGDEVILYHNLNNVNQVIVKKGEKEDYIILDGDQTRFSGGQFSEEEQQQILGYISWLKFQ